MSTSNLIQDLVLAVWLGVWLFLYLWKAVHLGKWLALVTAFLTAAVQGTGYLMVLIAGTHELARPAVVVAIVLLSLIPVVFYSSMAIYVIWLADGVWWLFTRSTSAVKRLKIVRVCTVVAVVLSVAVTGYGYVKAEDPAINNVTLSFPDLPSNFDGMTIALVTDIHISAMTRSSFLPMIVDEINDAHPDLVVIAGDLVDGTVATLGDRMSILTNLEAPDGVVITLGNHEIYNGAQEWSDFYTSLGLTVLTNDALRLTHGSQSITLLGIADLNQTGPLTPDLPLAIAHAGSCEDAFCVLVAHEPAQILADDAQAPKLGVDLQLSGHTHGGQWWPMRYLNLLDQPANEGVHVIDGTTLVISRGAGTFGPPVRVGADPEIPLITLTAA